MAQLSRSSVRPFLASVLPLLALAQGNLAAAGETPAYAATLKDLAVYCQRLQSTDPQTSEQYRRACLDEFSGRAGRFDRRLLNLWSVQAAPLEEGLVWLRVIEGHPLPQGAAPGHPCQFMRAVVTFSCLQNLAPIQQYLAEGYTDAYHYACPEDDPSSFLDLLDEQMEFVQGVLLDAGTAEWRFKLQVKAQILTFLKEGYLAAHCASRLPHDLPKPLLTRSPG